MCGALITSADQSNKLALPWGAGDVGLGFGEGEEWSLQRWVRSKALAPAARGEE